MKKVMLFAILSLWGLPSIRAQEQKAQSGAAAPQAGQSYVGQWVLGLIAGSPTGLGAKYRFSRINAFSAGLGVPIDSDVKFHVFSDLLWQMPVYNGGQGELEFLLGTGLRLRVVERDRAGDKVDSGVRIPVGLEFLPKTLPLSLGAEIVPVIEFTSGSGLGLDGVVSIRYRFH